MRRLLRVLLIAAAAGLAGYLTWDRVELHRLDGAIADIAARGEPVDPASLRQEPADAQQQQAALLYADAATRARDLVQQDGRLMRFDVDGVVGRVDLEEIESTFRKDSPPLQKPEQRVEMEKEADLAMIREQEKERSNFDRMMGVFGKKDKQ